MAETETKQSWRANNLPPLKRGRTAPPQTGHERRLEPGVDKRSAKGRVPVARGITVFSARVSSNGLSLRALGYTFDCRRRQRRQSDFVLRHRELDYPDAFRRRPVIHDIRLSSAELVADGLGLHRAG